MKFENKLAYYRKQQKSGENYNFHDYPIKKYEKHFVVENGWDERFYPLLMDDIEALSIVSTEHKIDIQFIAEHFPNIKQLFVQCKSTINTEVIFGLSNLEELTYCCQDNRVVDFTLPSKLKSLSLDWKSKYSLSRIPSTLEYLSIDDGKGIDWTLLLKSLKSLIKIDLVNCDIADGTLLLNLPKLRYFALTNCKLVRFDDIITINKSLKYINFAKVPVEKITWVSGLDVLDILILEGCGDIDDANALQEKKSLRGLSFSGNTKFINGDLNVLESLDNLQNCFIAPQKHYSHKSLRPWNWKNFDAIQQKLIARK